MSILKVVGFDMAMSNFGICQASVDIATLEIKVDNLILVKTTGESKKGVAKNCDDLRRAQEVHAGMILGCQGASLAIAEVPLGSASNYKNGVLSAGLSVGVLASCPIPLIPVFVADVKKAAVGHQYACKEEMMEWAFEKWPGAPWLMGKVRGKVQRIAANEHLADACAVVNWGVRTPEFQKSVVMMRSMLAAAG